MLSSYYLRVNSEAIMGDGPTSLLARCLVPLAEPCYAGAAFFLTLRLTQSALAKLIGSHQHGNPLAP